MRKTTTTDVTFNHEAVTFTNPGFTVAIQLDKITEITIDEEAAATADEQELDIKKLLGWEPELADLLRMQLVAGGTAFCVTVTKEQGSALADHFKSKLPREIFGSGKAYPIHVRAMGEGLFK